MTIAIHGDARVVLPTLPAGRFRCCVTSPPYWMQRDYLPAEDPLKHLEIGREETIAAYVQVLVEVFREVRRALTDDGTLWINIGDKWANDAKWGGKTGGKHARRLHGKTGIGRAKVQTGLPPKSLMGIPWRLAFALQDDGWTLRSEIIWHKPNAMPEGHVSDRPHRSHEKIFLFAKAPTYVFDRSVSPRDVWSIPTEPGNGDHAAPMPTALARRCILAGSSARDEVLDPFGGQGTVGRVAEELGRRATLIDLDERAVKQATKGLSPGPLFTVESDYRDTAAGAS